MSTAALVPAEAPTNGAASYNPVITSGISADELAARVNHCYEPVSARALRSWLLESGLAVETRAGLLQPTPAAVEIADFLHAGER